MNPDHLRTDKDAVAFVHSFFEAEKRLVTSRHPSDTSAFTRKMIDEFAEGAATTRMDRNTIES